MDLQKWVTVLSNVEGIDAIVLGGSKSRGEDDRHSDTDIGIYYSPTIQWDDLENALKILMDHVTLHEKVLYLPGEWGPFVNGGAWLTVDKDPVDVILRDTERVASVIEDCLTGIITIENQTGHPFGFVNSIYAAEVHAAHILWEKEEGKLSQLKELLQVYPAKMKEAVMERFLFEADFSMETARKPACRQDIHYVLGCFFRTVGSWNQILYALNERYFMNEKGSLQVANELPIRPTAYTVRVKQTYQYFSDHHPCLAFEEYDLLKREIEYLVETHRQDEKKK